jgi:hypothetical protein
VHNCMHGNKTRGDYQSKSGPETWKRQRSEDQPSTDNLGRQHGHFGLRHRTATSFDFNTPISFL